MSDQKVNRLTKTCVHVKELNILISNLGEDLLNLKRIQIFICVLQTFLNVWVQGAAMFKLLG